MIKEAIIQLAAKQDLSYETAAAVMDEIMSGQASQIQMASFLTALAIKGETIDEITACAAGMRAHCVRLLHDVDALEIVGTGGDGANSFNISTTSAFVIAAGGVPVAKHGNRAASSKSGAADVLEALGVNIALSPEQSAELLRRQNFCFLFAQNYHISMKYVAPVRKELGIRTVFNILGPLSNPAGANRELMGVYDEALVEPLAQVMSKLDVARDYQAAGADCISCLTEPKWFLGSDQVFGDIRASVSIPMLRKDFTVDEYQIYQTRLLGAEAVLLICALLDTRTIARYLELCGELGLSAVVEAHDETELASAVSAGASIIGVNNRNLKDFSVDFATAARLRERIPPEVLYVAESGVTGPADVAELKRIGADAVLMGEVLMRAKDRAALLAALREAAK